ncbi:MAG TPA: hypothetical protein VEY89_01160 [Candidatus Dormibacteraeota bacterium]|nr:hypothetical protein [Candidatus Dormibacteraeota bacterium]
MKENRMRGLTVMLLASLVSVSAEAGVVLKVDTKDDSGKSVPNEVYYAQDGMLRIDSLDARGSVARVEVVRDGVIWQIDPRERTFTRIDQAALKQLFGGGDARLEAMLANLPPERRALMEARMAQMRQKAAHTEYTFSDAGRGDHAGQYSCRVWQEQRDGKPFAEYCVVPASSLPAGAELDAALKKAVATTEQLVAGVPQLAKQAEHLTRLGKLGGFPASWHFVSSATDVHVLSSARAESLPADKFAIPQGYTEKAPDAGAGN